MPMHNPAHPGLALKDGLGDINITDFAKHLGVSRVTISRILNGKQGISADMSIRLSRALGTNPSLWLDMQKAYDLWQVTHHPKIDYTIITPYHPKALDAQDA